MRTWLLRAATVWPLVVVAVAVLTFLTHRPSSVGCSMPSDSYSGFPHSSTRYVTNLSGSTLSDSSLTVGALDVWCCGSAKSSGLTLRILYSGYAAMPSSKKPIGARMSVRSAMMPAPATGMAKTIAAPQSNPVFSDDRCLDRCFPTILFPSCLAIAADAKLYSLCLLYSSQRAQSKRALLPPPNDVGVGDQERCRHER